MIRLALLLAMIAAPVAAQDFRGLRPGMPASALGPIGEPVSIQRDGALTQATYPLPFQQRLQVLYDNTDTLMWLNSYGDPDGPAAPDRGGLQADQMALRDVERHLGPRPMALDTPGLAVRMATDTGFRLAYDHPETDAFLVVLSFTDQRAPSRNRTLDLPLPRDAQFVGAELIHRAYFNATTAPDAFLGGPRSGPIPFPIPVDEAFPSLIP